MEFILTWDPSKVDVTHLVVGEFCVPGVGCFPKTAPTETALDTGHNVGTNPAMPPALGETMGWIGTVKFILANFVNTDTLLNDAYIDGPTIVGDEDIFEVHIKLLADVPAGSPAAFSFSEVLATDADTLLLDATVIDGRLITQVP